MKWAVIDRRPEIAEVQVVPHQDKFHLYDKCWCNPILQIIDVTTLVIHNDGEA